MEYNLEELKHFDKLKDAKCFLYRLRVWIEGDSSNIIFWKEKNNSCYHFESSISIFDDKKEEVKIIGNEKMKLTIFNKFIQDLVSYGIMELKTDISHKVMTNYHDYYYILSEDMKMNSFQAICGHHSDSRFKDILNVVNNAEF